MAVSKEALAIVLDVSVGMARDERMVRTAAVLEAALKQKFLFAPADEVAVVLFGTDGTDNELFEQEGGYEHVTVLQPFDTVGMPLLRSLRAPRADEDREGEGTPRLPCVLRPSAHDGDFIDGLMVALDLLKRRTRGKRLRRRVMLLTAAASPLGGVDDLELLLQKVAQDEIELDIVGVGFDSLWAKAKLPMSAAIPAHTTAWPTPCPVCHSRIRPSSPTGHACGRSRPAQ